MKTVVHLDKDDIERIVAKTFDVDLDSVCVECFMDYEPNAMGGQDFPNVRVTITNERTITP